MSELDRRELLRRGGVGAAAAGAAWLAPTILATPAYAGGSCAQEVTFAWSTLGHDALVNVSPTPFASYAAINANFPALTIGQTPTAVGTPTNGLAPQTGRVSTNEFGAAFSCYRQSMSCNATGEGWDSVFAFSNPVWNLRFTLYDIDEGAYIDHAFLTSAASFTFTAVAPAEVTGAGTSGNPWVGQSGAAADETSGNVLVVFAGPVSSFTLSFRSGNSSNATQAIGLGDMTFCR